MIPQIFTVTPDEGLPSGRLRVTLTGYGFKVGSPLSPDDGPAADPPPTIAVYFGTELAEFAVALHETEAVAVAPSFMGEPSTLPATVSVSLANLDAAGVPIPGELAVRPDAWTYRREDLAQEAPVQWLVRQVIRELKRNVLDNVEIGASPDWSDDPLSGLVALASLPAVVLQGPRVVESKRNRQQISDVVRVDDGDRIKVNAPPLCVDAIFGILAVGRSKTEVLALQSVIMRLFDRRPFLVIPSGPVGANVSLRRWLSGEWVSSDRPTDSVFVEESEFTVEGVTIDDDYGLASDGVPVDDVLTARTEDGDGAVEVNTVEKP